MSWLGVQPFKKFPAPFLKPYWPFFAAGIVIAYGVNSVQTSMMSTAEWKNDARNPNAKTGGH
ncbi:ATPase, F0 complex, subunit J [Ilyonectria destructans]|nr:ATPase, F0 complex, subunit J [Ilyonectria destructans]